MEVVKIDGLTGARVAVMDQNATRLNFCLSESAMIKLIVEL